MMVPASIAQWVPETSLLCFRGCRQEGMMYHEWWMCAKVCKFWICTYNFIDSLTGTNLTKSLQHAFLGHPVGGAPRSIQCPIAFIFIAARITMARSWKSPVPSFDLLKNKLSWIMVNKHFSAILQDKLPRLEKTWDP